MNARHGLVFLALLSAVFVGACGEPQPPYDPALVAASPAISWDLLVKSSDEQRTRERDEQLDAGMVRIAGYLVPLGDFSLDQDRAEPTEFLLVPYVGACMHLPPPPPDQMIHVQMAPGRIASVNLWSWEPLEVAGVIRAEPLDSIYGSIGYRMEGMAVKEYELDWESAAAAQAHAGS